jgi:hypothetical protein
VKKTQTLSKEAWINAAEAIENVAPHIATFLLTTNCDGLGKEDAEEFTGHMQMASMAIRYVAENATDKCRFIVIPD